MTKDKKQCPDCQTSLKAVSLSDLITETGGRYFSAEIPTEIALSEYFDFYVCAQCGRTLIYAGATVRKIASGETGDSDEGLVGIS